MATETVWQLRGCHTAPFDALKLQNIRSNFYLPLSRA